MYFMANSFFAATAAAPTAEPRASKNNNNNNDSHTNKRSAEDTPNNAEEGQKARDPGSTTAPKKRRSNRQRQPPPLFFASTKRLSHKNKKKEEEEKNNNIQVLHHEGNLPYHLLPSELWVHVLQYLPPKDQHAASLVNRLFRSWALSSVARLKLTPSQGKEGWSVAKEVRQLRALFGERCAGIRSLDLTEVRWLTGGEIGALCEAMPALTKLKVQLPDNEAAIVLSRILSRYSNIVDLSLPGSTISRIGISHLPRSLRSLSLSGNMHLREADLTGNSLPPSLRKLSLANTCSMGDTTLSSLPTTLRTLNLNYCLISERALLLLAQRLPLLRSLHLAFCHVPLEGLSHFVESGSSSSSSSSQQYDKEKEVNKDRSEQQTRTRMPKLQRLNLYGANFTLGLKNDNPDAVAEWLEQGPFPSTLRALSLSFCPLSKKAIRALPSGLRELDLCFLELGRVSLLDLEECLPRGLQRLNLWPLTESSLFAANPHVKDKKERPRSFGCSRGKRMFKFLSRVVVFEQPKLLQE
ncbi:hypothetical protein QOT17_013400 [Balamuthia mandrillaris]